jgi:hypothetical protein
MPKDSKFQSLGATDAGATMASFHESLIRLMPVVLGVPPEILGELSTKDHSSALFQGIRKQMHMSLSHIANNLRTFLYNQGAIFRDLLLELADASETGGVNQIVIPRIAPGHDKEDYVMLSRRHMARAYAIRMTEAPMGDDERQRQFEMFVDMLRNMPESVRINALPEVVRLSRLDEQQKDKLAEAMQPAEPSKLDQEKAKLEVSQLAANIRMTNANAQQLESQSQREIAAAQEDMTQADVERNKARADLAKTRAETEHTEAETDKTQVEAATDLSKLGLEMFDRFNGQFADTRDYQ